MSPSTARYGGYATKDFLRAPPASVEVVSRLLISGKLYTCLHCLLAHVVARRPASKCPRTSGQRKPPLAVDAFCSTDLALSAAALLQHYRDWRAVEIMLRDSNTFDGLGQDQCRKVRRTVGGNTFRLLMAAARTLWCAEQVQRTGPVDLQRYRPWYRKQYAPSQLDIVWACREALHEAGVFPIPRFTPALAETSQEPQMTLRLVA